MNRWIGMSLVDLLMVEYLNPKHVFSNSGWGHGFMLRYGCCSLKWKCWVVIG